RFAAAVGAASGVRRRVLMPGRSASPTPLRCSGAGLAAETPFAHLRFAPVAQPRRKSEWIACVPVARTPAPRPALLAAPQIARAAGHPPRRGAHRMPARAAFGALLDAVLVASTTAPGGADSARGRRSA